MTVRTLHHYDKAGLLSPGDRSPAWYRRSDDADLARLHQILFHRELGFPVEEIAEILRDSCSWHRWPGGRLTRYGRLRIVWRASARSLSYCSVPLRQARLRGCFFPPRDERRTGRDLR